MAIKGRFYELDAIRGLAALAVILYHYTTRYSQLYDRSGETYILDFKYGYLGVHLFFIISGFVIFMTLEKSANIKNFAFKRAVRLYPAYITAVMLTFILVKWYSLEGREVDFISAILNLTMFQGFIPSIPYVDGSYWSLTVELTFYILMGVIFVLGFIKKIEVILISWLGFSFFVEGLSIFFDNVIITGLKYYGITDYGYLFIAGIMFYKLSKMNNKQYHLIIFACLAYGIFSGERLEGIAIFSFFLLFYALIYGKVRFLNNKILVFFGTISYSLYLVHQNIGYIIINFLEKNGFTSEFYILIPIMISIGLATLITYFIEKPIQSIILNRSKIKQRTKLSSDVSRESHV